MSTGWGPPSVPPQPPGAPGAWGSPPPPAPGSWGGPRSPEPPAGAPAPTALVGSTRRRSRVPRVVLLVVVAAGVAAAWFVLGGDRDPVAGDWSRHELPSGAVSVELPGDTTGDSGVVWTGAGPGLSGSALWTGDGGYERAAPGIVVIEGDAAQIGLSPDVIAAGGTALLDTALRAYLTEIGADPDPTLDDRVVDGRPTRQAFATAEGGDLGIVAVAIVDGTRVAGVVVTTPAIDDTSPADVAERVVTSLRFG